MISRPQHLNSSFTMAFAQAQYTDARNSIFNETMYNLSQLSNTQERGNFG